MATELHELLEAVHDQESFLSFVRALKEDREAERGSEPDPFGRGANGWENHTIEDFLGAALAWAESTNVGSTQGMEKESLWKRFAAFLYCGKVFE